MLTKLFSVYQRRLFYYDHLFTYSSHFLKAHQEYIFLSIKQYLIVKESDV